MNKAIRHYIMQTEKLKRVARLYLEHGEPELAEELETLLTENNTPLDSQMGLYRKYRVDRMDDVTGKHNDCFYFVLDTVHDPFAIPALKAYSSACKDTYPLLAQDIDTLLEAKEK